MNCQRCGEELAAGVRFCSACGAEVVQGRFKESLSLGISPSEPKTLRGAHGCWTKC